MYVTYSSDQISNLETWILNLPILKLGAESNQNREENANITLYFFIKESFSHVKVCLFLTADNSRFADSRLGIWSDESHTLMGTL